MANRAGQHRTSVCGGTRPESVDGRESRTAAWQARTVHFRVSKSAGSAAGSRPGCCRVRRGVLSSTTLPCIASTPGHSVAVSGSSSHCRSCVRRGRRVGSRLSVTGLAAWLVNNQQLTKVDTMYCGITSASCSQNGALRDCTNSGGRWLLCSSMCGSELRTWPCSSAKSMSSRLHRSPSTACTHCGILPCVGALRRMLLRTCREPALHKLAFDAPAD